MGYTLDLATNKISNAGKCMAAIDSCLSANCPMMDDLTLNLLDGTQAVVPDIVTQAQWAGSLALQARFGLNVTASLLNMQISLFSVLEGSVSGDRSELGRSCQMPPQCPICWDSKTQVSAQAMRGQAPAS